MSKSGNYVRPLLEAGASSTAKQIQTIQTKTTQQNVENKEEYERQEALKKDWTTDENIQRLLDVIVRDATELDNTTNYRKTNLDEFYDLPSKWLRSDEPRKMKDKSPFTSWRECAEVFLFEVWDVRSQASRHNSEGWNSWRKIAFYAFFQWMYLNWGAGKRASESWDSVTHGAGEAVGNIAGGVASGVTEGTLGTSPKTLLIIGLVGVVAIIAFASSKKGGQLAGNVGKTGVGQVKAGGS